MMGSWTRMLEAKVLIFGCGNTLRGDDGLAPAVMHKMHQQYGQITELAFIDAGTSLRTLLFDVLLSASPERIIVLDVVEESGRTPSSINIEHVQGAPSSLPTENNSHLAPTRELLHAIHTQTCANIILLTVQIDMIPEGLSDELSESAKKTIPQLVQTLCELCSPYLSARSKFLSNVTTSSTISKA